MREQKDRYIRFKELRQKIPFSRTTFWRLESADKFPKRVQLGPNSVGWLESEVDQWIKEKANRPQDEVL